MTTRELEEYEPIEGPTVVQDEEPREDWPPTVPFEAGVRIPVDGDDPARQ